MGGSVVVVGTIVVVVGAIVVVGAEVVVVGAAVVVVGIVQGGESECRFLAKHSSIVFWSKKGIFSVKKFILGHLRSF